MKKSLEGKVAVVAGATRGAGRGIACMLGEAGAVVYCSGRNSRERPNTEGYFAGRPETIEETAEMVSARGGVGLAARTDHSDERQVEALGVAIAKARETGDWRHKQSKLCDWCAFQSLCPAFGGTPPPLPADPLPPLG